MAAGTEGPAAGAVIRLRGVTRRFESSDGSTVVALQDVNLELRAHEFVSVIGPSGCGKSTILRLVGGLLPVSAGELRIYDLPVTEPRDEIGIVFQKPTLLPWLTVLDNVTFPMRHKHGRVDARDVARAHELLKMTGLQDFAAKRPGGWRSPARCCTTPTSC